MDKQKNFVLYDESATFEPEPCVPYYAVVLENEFLYKALDALRKANVELVSANTNLEEENSLIREENVRVIGCDDELVDQSERLEAENNRLAHDNVVLAGENARLGKIVNFSKSLSEDLTAVKRENAALLVEGNDLRNRNLRIVEDNERICDENSRLLRRLSSFV